MSSKSVDKGVLDINDNDDIFEEFFSLNDLVISFSEIFGSERPYFFICLLIVLL
ncbi:hypothetical protein LCGC14_2730950 [marine sediment metagenome]|uniref:Uncharacterized protein n=1 Tax=marine sediment metagenome TaxID=412755 RepID=A0A0F8ZUK7_9ZZZZ